MENHEKTIKNYQNSGKQIYCSRKIFQQLKLTVWLKFLRQRESSIPPIPHQQCNCYIEYFIRGFFWFQGRIFNLSFLNISSPLPSWIKKSKFSNNLQPEAIKIRRFFRFAFPHKRAIRDYQSSVEVKHDSQSAQLAGPDHSCP